MERDVGARDDCNDCNDCNACNDAGARDDAGDRNASVARAFHEHYCALHDFGSLTLPEAIGTMEYRWSEAYQQTYFHLAESAPYAVGAGLLELRNALQERQLPIEAIRHWCVHTGTRCVEFEISCDLSRVYPSLG